MKTADHTSKRCARQVEPAEALHCGAGARQGAKDEIAFGNAEALIRPYRTGWPLPLSPVMPPVIYAVSELWATEGPRLI